MAHVHGRSAQVSAPLFPGLAATKIASGRRGPGGNAAVGMVKNKVRPDATESASGLMGENCQVREPFPSVVMRPAHSQEVTTAGSNAVHVPQSPGQFLDRKSVV